MTDLEKQAEAALAKETLKAKAWWAANREEAIALIFTSLAVGILLGALIGYVLRGHHT
jgi:F0F1-type ATP synthase assembly protein I